ncbi:Late embryogenesis abundant [Olea europaea subsp. europaea]|uniref:Late embryogenesis abundant n=1 Tax=Olea europaea subsp. europaea TaxID=158383 RepID=A0A8S0US30_OLEEU|nr:Late embryogenesis abundant [Olea europaea subsp. europaea]
MMHATSESDFTSISPYSSPASAKQAVYYVQSPSRDSHDEADKCSSSMHGVTSPTYHSSTDESPSNLSRHSMASAASRFSSRDNRRRGYIKGWRQCNVVEEEDADDDYYYENREFTSQCKILMVIVGFGAVFSVICLIIWGISRPYDPQISMKSLSVHDLFYGEGSDWTGVPTKFLTVNCTASMVIYNPAKFFGIHVSSDPVNLIYLEITVARGQLKKYYQPKKSVRKMAVSLEGQRVPLYGAGMSLSELDKSGGFPLKLDFEMKSRGYLIGKLVKTTHRRHVSCSLLLNSKTTKQIVFKQNSCKYD